MPAPVIVHGDVVTFLPTANTAIITASPASIVVTSSNIINSSELPVMTEADLSNITLQGTWPATYINLTYLGGTGVISIDSWSDYSTVLTKNGDPVAINPPGATGTYTLSIVTPAATTSVPPVLDTAISYTGTFTITTTQTTLKA